MPDTPNAQPTSDLPSDGDMLARWKDALAAEYTIASEEQPEERVGPYKLLRLIGEGGFGTVWLAERQTPFVQQVALKLIKPGMDSRSVIARFEQERQALAVMNHPGIAKVLDGGLTPKGRPYFAMEFVKGEPLTDFCDHHQLSIRDRLELFAQACEAVQHAHLKGIVHRDIKPSNILAFAVDGEKPRLKVIDFGIAKAMSHTLTEKTIFTETGQMIGTPAYMSPEQADSTLVDIDTRSDIYSLGVVLYEVVAGTLPFEPKELRAKGMAEIQRIIREDDPPTPSARLTTLATKDAERCSAIEKARGVALRQLAKELRSELEWIPLKAMRKDPRERYQSALEFARDLRDYLDGKPITAAPESHFYRARKWARRRRGRITAAVVLLLALGVGVSADWITVAFRSYAAGWRFRDLSTTRWRLRERMWSHRVIRDQPDPLVVQDPACRSRVESTGLPWEIEHAVSGIRLLLVPPGDFYMGPPQVPGPRSHYLADPEHSVPRSIRRPFYLSVTEVSNAQWRAITGQNDVPDNDLPFSHATWNRVHFEFIQAGQDFFRLPSEVEWEYACRAGTTTDYYWGDEHPDFFGQGRVVGVSRCGSTPANPWGFQEMLGNVGELVADTFVAVLPPDGSEKALHGDPSLSITRGNGSDASFRRLALPVDGWKRGLDGAIYPQGFRVAVSVDRIAEGLPFGPPIDP